MDFKATGGAPMHSHDRTLVSKLLASDPDKSTPRHDMACHYLARPETATKLMTTAFPYVGKACNRVHGSGLSDGLFVGLGDIGFTFEHHLTKGEGKYQTTIGFVDLVVSARLRSLHSHEETVYHPAEYGPPPPGSWSPPMVRAPRKSVVQKSSERLTPLVLGVEVKISPVPVSDVVRQVKLYRQYFKADGPSFVGWALVTGYALSGFDREMLVNEGIFSFELGGAFEAWLQDKQNHGQLGHFAPIIL